MPTYKSDRVYLVDGVRTPVGVPYKSLKKFTTAHLSAELIRALRLRQRLDPSAVDEVVFGNAVSAGSGQNFAREAAILGGLPFSVPAYRVNNVCGSGLQAVIAAARSVMVGDRDCVVAGGAESVSRIPNFVQRDDDIPLRKKKEVDGLVWDGLWCQHSNRHMGDVCEALARDEGISREEQDAYALQSHTKTRLAVEAGHFEREIVPVALSASKVLAHDEHLRKKIRIENYEGLHPVFQKNGTITAGTASSPCDGAAAVLVASRRFCRGRQPRPLARLSGYVSVGVDPRDTFRAAVPAIQQCLKICRWSLSDVDLFEVCEAFAAQAIYTRRQLMIPEEKFNIYGGDIALGHPLGAAGARILVTLMHALTTEGLQKGLAVVCLGGGGAVAMGIERVS